MSRCQGGLRGDPEEVRGGGHLRGVRGQGVRPHRGPQHQGVRPDAGEGLQVGSVETQIVDMLSVDICRNVEIAIYELVQSGGKRNIFFTCSLNFLSLLSSLPGAPLVASGHSALYST